MDKQTPRAPWTVRVGLALLWLAFASLAAVMVLLTVFYVATLDLPGAQPSVPELTMGVLTVLAALLTLTVLILATLGKGWARWVAGVAGIAAGSLALLAITATRSPAPETVAFGLAAVGGGVLLLLPASGRWYAGAAGTRSGDPSAVAH